MEPEMFTIFETANIAFIAFAERNGETVRQE